MCHANLGIFATMDNRLPDQEALAKGRRIGLPRSYWYVVAVADHGPKPEVGSAIVVRYLGAVPLATTSIVARIIDQAGTPAAVVIAIAILALSEIPSGGRVTFCVEAQRFVDILSGRLREEVPEDLIALYDVMASSYDIDFDAPGPNSTPRIKAARHAALLGRQQGDETPTISFADLSLTIKTK